MVLLKKRAHLVLKTSLAVVRFLPFDVLEQRAQICWTDGKQTIPTLPRETGNTLLLHPYGRSRLDLRHHLRRRLCGRQLHRQMNMVGHPADTETIAPQFACRPRKISAYLGLRPRLLCRRAFGPQSTGSALSIAAHSVLQTKSIQTPSIGPQPIAPINLGQSPPTHRYRTHNTYPVGNAQRPPRRHPKRQRRDHITA